MDIKYASNNTLKRNARLVLNRAWSMPIVMALILSCMNAALGALTVAVLSTGQTAAIISGLIAELILFLLIRLFYDGAYMNILHLFRGEPSSFKDFIYVFQNQPDRFIVAEIVRGGLMILYMVPYAIAFRLMSSGQTVSGVILLFIWLAAGTFLFALLETDFSLAVLLMLDSPSERKTAPAALKESRSIMRGHRRQLFLLALSYLPWFLLCIPTMGVGTLFVRPYFMASVTAFYESLLYPAELTTF